MSYRSWWLVLWNTWMSLEIFHWCVHSSTKFKIPKILLSMSLIWSSNNLPAYLQRCKNIRTCKQCLCKKVPISGKMFAKMYAVLSIKGVMSQFWTFWWHFFGTFFNFMLLFGIFGTIWVFWPFMQIRFVIIYALFRVKLFWLKPCLF